MGHPGMAGVDGHLKTPRAVLFDAGGVLLLPDPAAIRAAVAPFGVTPDDEACRRSHYEAMFHVDRLGSFVDWLEVDRLVGQQLGVPEVHLDEVAHALDSVYGQQPWVPIPGAAETLRAVQAAGYPLAVVSNATGTMEQQLATHEICSVTGEVAATVAIVVDSHVVGVEKPDPAIFRFALDALGLTDGEDCIYVGDSVMFDVAGARAAGLHPLHLDPYGLCPGIDDHGHLRALGELTDVLPATGSAHDHG